MFSSGKLVRGCRRDFSPFFKNGTAAQPFQESGCDCRLEIERRLVRAALLAGGRGHGAVAGGNLGGDGQQPVGIVLAPCGGAR